MFIFLFRAVFWAVCCGNIFFTVLPNSQTFSLWDKKIIVKKNWYTVIRFNHEVLIREVMVCLVLTVYSVQSYFSFQNVFFLLLLFFNECFILHRRKKCLFFKFISMDMVPCFSSPQCVPRHDWISQNKLTMNLVRTQCKKILTLPIPVFCWGGLHFSLAYNLETKSMYLCT